MELSGGAGGRASANQKTPPKQLAELCCVLEFAGKPALPFLLGRGAIPRWTKWLLGRPLQWELRSRAYVDREPSASSAPGRYTQWSVASARKGERCFKASLALLFLPLTNDD